MAYFCNARAELFSIVKCCSTGFGKQVLAISSHECIYAHHLYRYLNINEYVSLRE